MAAMTSISVAKADDEEVTIHIPNLVKVFKDGSIERLQSSPLVPPSTLGSVSSKDIVISSKPSISARLYLPTKLIHHHDAHKVPILVYFHGGAFFFESAFNERHHNYFNLFLSKAEADILVVSVEYRLAPEIPLPAAYHDCWQALKWVASTDSDPWILNHGDFQRVFLGGDSAGANLVHNVALRAGAEALPNGVKVLGAFLSQPYFSSTKPIGSEAVEGHEESPPYVVWGLVYPNAPGGLDNPLINPLAPEAPSLATLGCSKIIVCVAEKDSLRDRGVWYYQAVKNSGWHGHLELYEAEHEDHVFNIHTPESENALKLMKRLAHFILH
ncbi:2-hydroxyisoflavanone dehydratase-like [Arachis stenosperma]|uniref:2-hydroxyisoflavanone dehydratase-like n=1 Tax=Arachis stenosperma TaxID=217475 RepID=UPI0025AB7191|nr:2-hydroxyisoflavanone dehydratase-like [Arachis stenosperma]